MVQIPEPYASQVRQAKDALWPLVKQARAHVVAGDLPGLASTAAAVRHGLSRGHRTTGGWLNIDVEDVVADLDKLYDSAFPPPASAGADTYGSAGPEDRLRYVAEVLDAPWSTAQRRALLSATVDSLRIPPWLDGVAEEAMAAEPSAARTAVLRLALCSPVARIHSRNIAAQVLEAVHRAGALDATVVEAAFTTDTHLGNAVYGWDPGTGEAVQPVVGLECAIAVRDHLDEMTWRLTAVPGPEDWAGTPQVPPPRGLRFVLRGLDVWAGRMPTAPGLSDDGRYVGSLVDHLCAAELTGGERAELVEMLRQRAEEERLEAFLRRYEVGDPEPLLALFDLERAATLLRLMLDLSQLGVGALAGRPVRCDRELIRATVTAVGEPDTRRLLALFTRWMKPAGPDQPAPPRHRAPIEAIEAAMGWNRAAVLKRVRNHALQGIAAYGLLPLEPDETPLDRYLALRESAKKGATFGPERRHSHATAVEVAFDHLAQVAGCPDASRLEWDLEARIAAESPGEWSAGDYAVAVRLDGAEPVIEVSRAGRPLKAVPAQVRKDPGYAEARTHQERLRDQARRMRTGLIERLVATSDPVGRDELDRWLSLPAGSAMLPALIWRSTLEDVTGLLDPAGPALVGLDGVRTPVTGPIAAAHPWQLYQGGCLAAWQAEVVRRRLRQPVRQAFRELYLLTSAELTAGTTAARFAGHLVNGKVAAQLLSGRGWSIHGAYASRQATRIAGDLTAGLACEVEHYFGGGPATTGAMTFTRDGVPVELSTVPPVALSEAMRDIDLVVSVAGLGGGPLSTASATSRAELLAALIGELGLDRVTVTGHTATVRGSRATYRVHLGGGSIHVEPAGYLCVVPASFGQQRHRQLFLPFADEDAMTSLVLSKVLLLAEDEKITDESILSQLRGRG
jgi:hypothetical protein